MIEHSRLLELLRYCPSSGVFTRKVSLSPMVSVGDTAGSLVRGYVELYVDGERYLGHNLAWFYVYKVWPHKKLDHIDRVKSNNAISNLRLATTSQNGANCGPRRNNLLGFKGVTKHNEKFKEAIMVNRRRIHLGVFSSAKDAARSYDQNAIKYFGQFAVTNKQLGLL